MGFTTNQYVATMQNIGKLIYLAKVGWDNAATYRNFAINAVKQFALNPEALDTDGWSFDILTSNEIPLIGTLTTLAAAADNNAVVTKAMVDVYLLKIADPLSDGQTFATAKAVATLLGGLLADQEIYFNPSDPTSNPYDNFIEYFYTQYQVTLPSSGETLFPDSWISANVVAIP